VKRGMRVISRFARKLVSGVHDVELWEIIDEEWRALRSSA
jgi:hypothetical protein